MLSSQQIYKMQENKIRKNWKHDGYFGILKSDLTNNSDTHNLIMLYAAENREHVYLLTDKSGKMEYKCYDRNERIYSYDYRYITNSEETAIALCKAHSFNINQLYTRIEQVVSSFSNFYYLIWN